MLAKLGEHTVDMGIDTDIAFDHEVGTEFRGRFLDTIFQTFVLVGERELRTFTMHRLGNTPGDAATAGNANDQDPLAMQEAHGLSATR
jgi:hypothetical protein